MLGEAWRLIPLDIDPPDHAKYRALLNLCQVLVAGELDGLVIRMPRSQV